MLLDDGGNRLLYLPLMNYANGNLDDVREMMTSPYAILGLSDAGAHCNAISDGSFPTTAIAHWTRDRHPRRGARRSSSWCTTRRSAPPPTSAGTTAAWSRPATWPT